MATWTRKPQEVSGTQRFTSRMVVTRAADATLMPGELGGLCELLWRDVAAHDGLDYLQVFEADDGRVIWCIDDGSFVVWLLPSDY